MGGLNRTVFVTTLSLRTLRQRAGASAVTTVGVAGVVLVFVAVLSIAEGFQTALAGAGSPDTAIIMRGGSDNELSSALAHADNRIIKDAAGVRDTDSGPVASAELFVVVNLLKAHHRHRGQRAPARGRAGRVRRPAGSAPRRGPLAPPRHQRDHRRPHGHHAASRARARLRPALGRERVGVGRRLRDRRRDLRVRDLVRCARPAAAYRRGDSFQSVLARLESPVSSTASGTTLTTDPRLAVAVEREATYCQGSPSWSTPSSPGSARSSRP